MKNIANLKYAYFPVNEVFGENKGKPIAKRIVKRVMDVEAPKDLLATSAVVGVSTTFFGKNVFVMTYSQAHDLLLQQHELEDLPLIKRTLFSYLVDKIICFFKRRSNG